MPIKLQVPPVKSIPDPAVEIRPVYVEEWVESLPYADPVALSRLYFVRLREFNRSPVKPALRYALLEYYLKPYFYLLDLQEKHGPIQTIGALERHRSATDTGRQIAVELAFGYKHVLSQAMGKRSLFGDVKEMRLALQRTVMMLSHAMLHAYDEYLPAPPGPLVEMAALFRYAQHQKIDAASAPPPPGRSDLGQSIGTLFKRILLTGLVDPYHQQHGDVWRLYRLFGEHAEAATLSRVEGNPKGSGRFVLAVDHGYRPLPIGKVDAFEPKGARILDANPVRDALGTRLSRLQEGGELTVRSGTTASLLGSMIRALGLPPKRHLPRERSEGRVGVTTGIRSVHHFLGGSIATVPSLVDVEMVFDDDSIDLGEPVASPIASTDGRSFAHEFWELNDLGPGGLGIVKNTRPATTVAVGELIAVQIPMKGQAGTDWTIGVIRWLSIDGRGDYQAGVQILTSECHPVTFVDESSTTAGSGFKVAIVMPDLKSAEGTLLTPSGVFGSIESLEVISGEDRIEVTPRSLVESTASFDRFTFSIRLA